jgi:hypothetical protein
MASYPKHWTVNETLFGPTKDLDFIDCLGFTSANVMALSNADYEIRIQWSMDQGVNVDLQEFDGVQLAGSTFVRELPIKARWLKFKYTDPTLVGGKLLRMQVSLNTKSSGASTSSALTLVNLGAGAELYDAGQTGIRSITSSDASVTVTQLVDEVNLAVVIPPATVDLAYAEGYAATWDESVPANTWVPMMMTTEFLNKFNQITVDSVTQFHYLGLYSILARVTLTFSCATDGNVTHASEIMKNSVVNSIAPSRKLFRRASNVDTTFNEIVITLDAFVRLDPGDLTLGWMFRQSSSGIVSLKRVTLVVVEVGILPDP